MLFDQDAVCEEALDESMCLKNPECSWCEGRCREYQPTDPVTLPCLQMILIYIRNVLYNQPNITGQIKKKFLVNVCQD